MMAVILFCLLRPLFSIVITPPSAAAFAHLLTEFFFLFRSHASHAGFHSLLPILAAMMPSATATTPSPFFETSKQELGKNEQAYCLSPCYYGTMKQIRHQPV